MAELNDMRTKVDIETTELLPIHNMQTCNICLQDISKYTCPRCNMGYCSLKCYQNEKHANCSEAFYKECVIDELKDLTNSSEDRQKVLKMLTEDLEQRAEEESEAGSEDDLAQRLQDLDIDKDISTVWSLLTKKEKEEFAHMLQDGRLAKLIEIWTPWWHYQENHKLVREETVVERTEKEMPEVLADIPDISILLKNCRPSSECRFEVVSVLFSYCFVSRIHNGCLMECPIDSTQDLLDMCIVLREQCGCGGLGEAIQNALDNVTKFQKNEGGTTKFNLLVLEDVKIIISGPGKGNSITFMAAALSDLVALLRTSLAIVRKELNNQRRAGQTEDDKLRTLKSQIFKSEKKLVFLLSWLLRYGMAMHKLLPLLQFEIETRQSDSEEIEEIREAVETHMDKLKPITRTIGHKGNEECELPKKIIEQS